jgi:hypothetical protein
MPPNEFRLPRIQGRDVQTDMQQLARDLRQPVLTSLWGRDVVVSDLRDRLEQQPIRAQRVELPMFEISNPTISLAEIRTRRFSITDRYERPLPASVLRILAALDKRAVSVEPPEFLGPIRRWSRYEVLVA